MATKKQTKTTSLALVGNTKMTVQDDDGRRYVDIDFDLNPEGGENDSANLPRLAQMKLLGSGAKELKKDTRVDGAEEGMFYNAGTGELFEKIEIVPLYIFIVRYFNHPPNSQNLVCMSQDGKGKFGICMSGDYETHGIPHELVEIDGVTRDVGICSRCPHSMRAYGQAAACDLVKKLVCVHPQVVSKYEEYVTRLQDDDPDVGGELLNEVFTLDFKSTRLKKLQMISDQAQRAGAYFKWGWEIGSFTDGNDAHDWQNYTVRRLNQLSADEVVFGRSLYKLIKKVRPVIADEDGQVVDEAQPEETDTKGMEG